ncbi:MAG: hypothetical protein ACRDTA_28165, partial [Pseudonocardiaceae bacterium]
GTRTPEATLGPLACSQPSKHPQKINPTRRRSTHRPTRGIGSEHSEHGLMTAIAAHGRIGLDHPLGGEEASWP